MRGKSQRPPASDRALSSPLAPFASFAPFALLAALAAFGCAPVPRPAVLTDVDQVRRGAAATEAKAHAPGAFAHAEKLRREADAAFADGDTAGAQLLGERALAAYAHAQALARTARAESSAAQASAATSAATSQLSSIDADQARVTAELSAIELRIKVAQDAQPVVPSGSADPAREKARLAAARSLALQAKLLCSAARLLYPPPSSSGDGAPSAPPAPPAQPAAPASPSVPAPAPAQARAQALAIQLDEATTAAAKLESDLSTAAVAPIDQASRVRAACLSVLTNIRRAATPVARAPGAGDALLAELSAAGSWSPSRDDRGVTVTLRGLFKGDALTPPGAARLTEIGRIAAAHPAFPIVVVVHHDKEVTPKDKAALTAQADRVVRAIQDAAKTARVEPVIAGAAAPVVDPAGEGRARNARVEVVFVTPETF